MFPPLLTNLKSETFFVFESRAIEKLLNAYCGLTDEIVAFPNYNSYMIVDCREEMFNACKELPAELNRRLNLVQQWRARPELHSIGAVRQILFILAFYGVIPAGRYLILNED